MYSHIVACCLGTQAHSQKLTLWSGSVLGTQADSTGQHVLVGITIYDSSLQLLHQAADPLPAGEFFPTALSADGSTLYEVMPYPKIVRCRVSDGAILDAVSIPVSTPNSWVRISDDGTLLITTAGGALVRTG